MIHTILKILNTIDHIPTSSLTKNQLIDIIDTFKKDKDNFNNELADKMVIDPALTIEFLKIANKKAFGFKKKISSITNSFLLLDDELIELIITQHPTIPRLRSYLPEHKYAYYNIIRHSFEVYMNVKNIFELALNKKYQELKHDLLTAAIIHDIGLLFVLIYLADDFNSFIEQEQFLNSKYNKHSSIQQPGHSLIGAILCNNWNIPPAITSYISFHHQPWIVETKFKQGAELLYIADSIASSHYEIFYPENQAYSFEELLVMKHQLINLIEKYGISIPKIIEIKTATLQQTKKFFAQLGASLLDS